MATPIAEGTVPWPDEFIQRYVAAGYWQGRPLGTLLNEAAAVRPDAVALVDGELRLTYAQLLDRADAAAARLAELGLQPGDRIYQQAAWCSCRTAGSSWS
jgi:salicylate---CoA ligase